MCGESEAAAESTGYHTPPQLKPDDVLAIESFPISLHGRTFLHGRIAFLRGQPPAPVVLVHHNYAGLKQECCLLHTSSCARLLLTPPQRSLMWIKLHSLPELDLSVLLSIFMKRHAHVLGPQVVVAWPWVVCTSAEMTGAIVHLR